MKTFTNKYLKEIESQIQKIERSENNEILKSSHILTLLVNKLEELKEFVTSYEFKSEAEEISFFKEIKPKILSRLIYYMSVYKIEVNRPTGSRLTIETYLIAELDRIKHYFDRNIELYRYYRTGCCHLDEVYFLRNHDTDIPMNIACFYFERDVRFSTGYDYKIAKIIANESLELYLKSELVKLNGQYQDDVTSALKTRETWTTSKTDLVELLYALHSAGCISLPSLI